LERRAGSEPLDDLPGAEVLFVGIGPHQVEVELVEGSLGQEVGAVAKGFQVEELIFDEAMDGFDVGLIGVGGGQDTLVLRAEAGDGLGKAGARPSFCSSPMNSPPLSVCQTKCFRSTPQRARWRWMRSANRALAPAERREA
jgi:hypothetical protein